MASEIQIRMLRPDDWESFRDLRLHAIETHNHVLSSGYEPEKFVHDKDRQENDWRDFLSSSRFKIFGAFDGDTIIGMNAIFLPEDRPDTAELIMSYLQPDYRGRGLSHMFYEARLDWIKAHDTLKHIIAFHRKGNEGVAHTLKKLGFIHVNSTLIAWPNGEQDDIYRYELDLKRSA